MFDMLVFMSRLFADGYLQSPSIVFLAKANGLCIVEYGSNDRFVGENKSDDLPAESREVYSPPLTYFLVLDVQGVLLYHDSILIKRFSWKTKFRLGA